MKTYISLRSALSNASWIQRSAVADEEIVPHAAAVLEMLQTADTPGTTCAVLTPAIKARLRELAGGQVLEVRVDDPSAHEDIAAWCRLAGHELLAVLDEMSKYTRYFLRKKHS
jgi:TusA-related sulfurtransferase